MAKSFLRTLCLLLHLWTQQSLPVAAFLIRLPVTHQRQQFTQFPIDHPVSVSTCVKSFQIQRKSVASVQSNLFGLGVAEVAIILVVVGAVLGPENIGRLIKSSGNRAKDISEELKKVPDEFKKGMEEGESDARARNAKRIRIVDKNGNPRNKEE